MSNPFLSKDGYINVEEMVALCREIDKVALKEQLKPAEIHFSGKVIPKFDVAKAKAGGEAFTKKRACPIKVRSRMPASGSRVKMVALLRNYKGLEEFGDLSKDFGLALKAIGLHNKQAEKTVASLKAAGAKKREAATKEFDKNADCVVGLLEDAGIKASSIAVGMSMMGKTIIVKLPNGGYVSIGKADAERFNKAKESAGAEKAAPAKTRGTRASKVVAAEEKPARSRRAQVEEKPARRSSRAEKAAAAPAKTRREKAVEAPVKTRRSADAAPKKKVAAAPAKRTTRR